MTVLDTFDLHQQRNLANHWLHIIRQESWWFHHAGALYQVLMLTNLEAHDWKRWPPTVVHRSEDGRLWSRNVNDWLRHFTPRTDNTQALEQGE